MCFSAPEYALDEMLGTASDMYSLGAVIHAVHCKGNPPYRNSGNINSLREHLNSPPLGMDRLDVDLQGEDACHCLPPLHSDVICRTFEITLNSLIHK